MSNKIKRKVLFITGSRGEYGYIKPIIELMNQTETLELEVLATNMHLIPEFGNTIKEFDNDGIPINYKIFMTLAGYTNTSMVKSLGVFLLSIADILSNKQPDIILIAGDRGEQLIAAIAGAHLNIPIAHIQAGELSGNIDGLTRHAISRFANIHFASNDDAERRLLNMGEEPFRVFKVGAPQLDEFLKNKIVPAEVIADRFSLDLDKPVILVVQHPVTEQALEAGKQIKATMDAINSLNQQTVIIYPNDDAGSSAIQEVIRDGRNVNIRLERNVPRDVYGGLMKVANVIVGNSSSGIIEAPSFELPAVNIGRRQDGRFQAKNVINVPNHESNAIKDAIKLGLSENFRNTLKGLKNPYGDGRSSEKIVKILETIPINEKLLFKKITY